MIKTKINLITLGIDASRNRSGGAQAHLIGLLSEFNPREHGVNLVHVWAYQELLDKLPNSTWLVKHYSPYLEQSLIHQIFWQGFILSKELRRYSCDILFATDASTFCFFSPLIVLSQDMLSYEPGVMSYFGISLARLRLILILLIQNLAFKRALGVIFLTKYASSIIQKSCGKLKNFAHIPHGVSKLTLDGDLATNRFSENYLNRVINCLYISNCDLYKHQWVVVEAISIMRNQGYNLKLSLVGGGSGKAQSLLEKAILNYDPLHNFVTQTPFVPHSEISRLLMASDLFIFASSCENMPITLIEAMAVGLPIACSDRGPMPEVLNKGGVYFDPENPTSIVEALKALILSQKTRLDCSKFAIDLSAEYSWKRCSNDTLDFIVRSFFKGKL